MRESGRFPVRVVLYGSIAMYLIGDLLLFRGPLRQKFDLANSNRPAATNLVQDKSLVARVSGHPILRSQLDRAVATRLWLEGKTASDIPPEDILAIRQAALDELIDRELLRLQAKALAPQLEVKPEEVDARMKGLLEKFGTDVAMGNAIHSQGIDSQQSLRDRIISEIRQEKYIELRLAPMIRVSDDEARTWFKENKEFLSLPERIEVRQIFLPTLDHPEDEAKARLESALADLTAKRKDFVALTGELSEDPATKSNGGNLGWMTRNRLPSDLAEPLFAMEIRKPALVRSHLGWHLMEVTARKPAEPQTFEQAKPEILAALESIRRHQATLDLRKSLRDASLAKIEIFPDLPE